RVEDADTARLLGLDPGGAVVETSEQEAQRLSREKPVVRMVHGLIADAVARRASDIHLRPGVAGTDVPYTARAWWCGCWTPTDRKSTRLNSSHVKISYAVFC